MFFFFLKGGGGVGWGREANGGGYLGWGREGRWLVLILLMPNSDPEGDRSREVLGPAEKNYIY